MISAGGIRILRYPGDKVLPNALHGDYHVHFVCLEGNGGFFREKEWITFRQDDLVILQGDVDFSGFEFSDDFECLILSVPRGFMRSMGNGMVWESRGFIHARMHPSVHLSGISKDLIINDLLSLEKRSSQSGRYSVQALVQSLQILMYDIWDVYDSAPAEEEHRLGNDVAGIFMKYQQLVKENCHLHRRVAWYADKLNVTPRQLSRICEKAGGSGAMQWIDHYTAALIMEQLENSDLSIDDICDNLNFSSKSFFTTYVKRVLGLPPSEYREKHSIT